MFTAELSAIGSLVKGVFNQGALFFDSFISDLNETNTKWYMLFFAAVIVYGLINMLLRRIKH